MSSLCHSRTLFKISTDKLRKNDLNFCLYFVLRYFTFISGYGILGEYYFGIFANIIMGYWDIRGVFKGYGIFNTSLNKPHYFFKNIMVIFNML